jgi:hypothetical protein
MPRLVELYYYKGRRGKYIQDLHLTDSRNNKTYIKDTKGGLLENSYYWVIRNSKFK